MNSINSINRRLGTMDVDTESRTYDGDDNRSVYSSITDAVAYQGLIILIISILSFNSSRLSLLIGEARVLKDFEKDFKDYIIDDEDEDGRKRKKTGRKRLSYTLASKLVYAVARVFDRVRCDIDDVNLQASLQKQIIKSIKTGDYKELGEILQELKNIKEEKNIMNKDTCKCYEYM